MNLNFGGKSSRSKRGAKGAKSKTKNKSTLHQTRSKIKHAVKGSKNKGSNRTTEKTMEASVDRSQTEKKGKKKDPWPAQETFLKMVSSGIFKEDAIANEFQSIPNPKPANSGQFYANSAKNRNKDWPISDEKLVKFTAPPQNYLPAARVTVPEFKRDLIVTQVPDPLIPGQVEEFWRMIFQEECLSMVLCSVPSDFSLSQFLPAAPASFANHGKMFLNNRKVDAASVAGVTAYTIELLPDGCSNSVLTVVYHLANWKSKRATDGTFGELVGVADKVLKANGNICTISLSGLGRCGAMALTLAAMHQIGQQKDVRMPNLLESMRGDRSGLVETAEQYTGCYKALAFWAKERAADEAEIGKKLGEFLPKM